jgi:tetratricopeptide (TPR) repeat protein
MKVKVSLGAFLLAPVAILFVTAGCSRDPEVAKREYVRSGDAYVAKKQYSEAVVEYRNAIQRDPRFGEARAKLADAYFQAGDVENAFREYIRAADLLSNDVTAQLKAGEMLLVGRRYEDARARADAALAREPQNVEAQILRANALAGLNKVDDAVKEVEDAIRRAPDRSASYANLGALQMIRGDRNEAEAAFKQAAAMSPKSPQGYLALANFYWAAGRQDEAETQLKTALSVDPKDELTNRALGYFYMGTGRAAEAEAPLKTFAEVARDGEGKLTLSDYYLAARRYGDARRTLEAVSQSDEQGYRTARLKLAGLDFQTGDRQRAYALVDEVLAKAPQDTDALLLKAQLLVSEGKLNEALAAVRQAIANDPRSAQAQYALGRLLVAQRDYQDAMSAFSEALKLNPDLGEVDMQLAKLHFDAGRIDLAEQFARSAATKIPGYTEAQILLAHIDLTKGRLESAERNLTALLKANPGLPVVQTEFGRLQLAKKNRGEARAAFERALSKDPNFVDALGALTQMDLEDKHLDVARARIDAAVKRNGKDGRMVALAGETYVALGDYKAAEPVLRQAIEADPGNLRTYGLLAQVLASQKRLADATREFENLAQRAPKSVGVQTFMAVLLHLQNRTEDARAQYQKVLEIDPRAAVAANNLAWMYAQEGQQLDIALQLAQTAKAQLPDDPSVSDTLAWVYYKKNLSESAIPLLEPLVRQDPNNPTYRYHLGLAYAQAGKDALARQSLERALALKLPAADAVDARKALDTLK